MASIIQLRRDTEANWTAADPILAEGEVGFETDTGRLKVGNGLGAWSALSYFSAAGAVAWGAITGTLSAQTDLQSALNARLTDAPSDGTQYTRQNGAWAAVAGGGGIPDAPSNGTTYGRRDGAWAPVEGGGGGGGGERSIFDPSKPGGALQSQKREYFDVGALQEVDIVNIASGSGYLSSVFVAYFGAQANWENARIKVYYDGSATPEIDMRTENFFISQYAATTSAMASEFFGFNRNAADTYGAYMNLPMPYTNGVRITITNATSNVFKIFATATIHAGVPNAWHRTKKLLAKSFFVSAAPPNSVQTLIDESASNGRLAAIWLLGDGFPGNVTPPSAWLEGNLAIYVDNSAAPSYESSGTEDYFLQSFYFGGAGSNRNGGEVGTTFVNVGAGTYGAWRTHVRNPIEFNSRIRVTWQVGDTTQVPFTGNLRAWASVFYYTG